MTIEELVAQVDVARKNGDDAKIAELEGEIRELTGGKPRRLSGEAHLILPFPAGVSAGLTLNIADWKRLPWRIRTAELHYKDERFGSNAPPPVAAGLLESIREHGIINPLLVMRAFDGRVYVWLGNQRLAAARELGIEWAPCITVDNEDDILEALGTYEEV